MKNLLVSVFLYLMTVSAFRGQEVPTIFPASPEASTLGKHGDIPINLSTGNINYGIPIHTIREGEFSLPISLSYSYSGLLVEEIPGITGLGWNLNAGGLITRQVRGRPDDDPYGYIGEHRIGENFVIPYLDGTLSEEEEDTFLTLVYEGSRDSQPDKFMLNVGGISASFYFDENKTPVILPYKPYNIEIIGDDLAQGIKVTDDQGIQYFFEETEITKRINLSVGDVAATPLDGYISSWKLSKIILLNQQEINFSYVPYQYKTRVFYESYQKINPIGSTTNCDGSLSSTVSDAKYEMDTKIIQQITFPKGTIVFDVQADDTTAFNQYLAALKGITVYNNNDREISAFRLEYSSDTNTRKVLHRVVFNNDLSNAYHFEYYGTYSGAIHYSNQDLWGYLNSNTSGKLISGNHMSANRYPDFNKSVSGALRNIHYPTKATTTFEYEAHTYDPGEGEENIDDFLSCANAPFNRDYTVSEAVGHWNPGTYNDAKTFEITDDSKFVTISLRVLKNNVIGNVEAGVRMISGTPEGINCYDADCSPYTMCSGFSISYGGGFATDPLENQQLVRVRLAQGIYEVYAEASAPFVEEYKSLEASASVSLWDESLAETGVSNGRARETGGIRIAKVTSCPDDSGQGCVTKRYTYENEEGISEGFLFKRRDLFSYDTHYSGFQNGGLNPVYFSCNKTTYSSSSNVPLAKFSGSHIIYRKVKEETIDTSENTIGSKTSTFVIQPGTTAETYPFPPIDEKEWRNGILQTKEITDHTGNIIRKTENDYQFTADLGLSNGASARGFKVGRAHFAYSIDGTAVFSPDYLVIAPTHFNASEDVLWLSKKTDTLYNHDQKTIENTAYTYTMPYGHVKEQISAASNRASVRVQYQYPYELNMPMAEALMNLNRLSIPIKKDIFNIDSLGVQELSHTKKISYQNFNGIILPEKIQSRKEEGVLHDEITYLNYDLLGNPLEISKKDHSSISYIWGYGHTLPIAKMEGISYEAIDPGLISNLQALSDNDNDKPSENALREALNTLRIEYPDSDITTFTYDPLIGITSTTDLRGQTTFYSYDTFNRLTNFKDAQEKLQQTYHYNYEQEAPLAWAPLQAEVNYGASSDDYQWFNSNVSGGSGEYSYAWYEGIGNSSISFQESPSGNDANYQLMVSCTRVKYVKLEVTDNNTGAQIVDIRQNNNSPCATPPLSVQITYGPSNDNSQWFFSNVSGGSGEYSYAWYKGIGSSSVNFENTPDNTSSSYQLSVPCTTLKYVKLVITDNITGNSMIRKKSSNNNPCTGNENDH